MTAEDENDPSKVFSVHAKGHVIVEKYTGSTKTSIPSVENVGLMVMLSCDLNGSMTVSGKAESGRYGMGFRNFGAASRLIWCGLKGLLCYRS